MSGIKNFILEVEEFVNNHELTFPSETLERNGLGRHQIEKIISDVGIIYGTLGQEHAQEYIKQQEQIS